MDLEVSFGDISIYNDQIVGFQIAKQPFNISIKGDSSQLYTLVIYDLSAPHARNPMNSPLIHFLEVNIPGSNIDQGDVILEYMPPSPGPKSGNHIYVVDLFRQNGKITPEISNERESFPLLPFTKTYNLTHQSRLIFRVNPDPAQRETVTSMDGQASPRSDWTQNLNEHDEKYCDCVIKVTGREPTSCIQEKAWFQQKEGHTCANPYSVCHSSVHGESGRPECGKHYLFENIPDQELVGYAILNGIPIISPYDRQALIEQLYQWEVQK